MDVRPAEERDLDQLARVWHDGWHDAHAAILPVELTQLRTLDTFRDRLRAGLARVRVIGPPGAPVGFCMLKDDELYQLFVAESSRGTGVAKALIADAEDRLRALGFTTAWLACAIGNDRAARFYEKSGWHRAATVDYHAETPTGTLLLQVWRYEKPLQIDSR
jgi:GNAT superfamily N-acetyltransferase